MTARGQVRHAFPAYKVYIFGVDVTEDVLDVDVDWNYGRAPNVCNITLANVDDKYVFTTADFLNLFKDEQNIVDAHFAKTNELRDANINEEDLGIINILDEQNINDQIERSVIDNTKFIKPEVKRLVIEKKISVKSESIPAKEVDGRPSAQGILNGPAFRYPLSAEDPIFHPNDPVRIFYRDPFKPKKWYHMFTGLVSDFDDHVDENNQKILTISGEGPTKLFRYARVTTDPGIIDKDAVTRSEQDIVLRSNWSSGFSKITLTELLFSMVFGNNPNDDAKFSISRESSVGTAVSETTFTGVGNFNFSRSAVLEFGPPSTNGNEDAFQSKNIQSIDNLGSWQSLIDHEVKITDLEEMTIPEFDGASFFSQVIRFADGTPDPTSIIDIIGKNPQLFPVDGGRLLMLIPASFHPSTNREILLKDMLQNFRLQTEFSSRLGIIYDTIERIEFVFYESPKGDLICEFPLYDFDPEDFGLITKFPHFGIKNKLLFESVDEERGPFGSRFITDKRDSYNFSRQFTDEKVRTQITAQWSTIQNLEAGGTNIEYSKPAVITLDHLVPLYGLRLEQVPPKGFIASKEAAYALAHVWLNRLNADAVNLGINAVPNFGLWLNRPLQFMPRNCIGTMASLRHSIKWGMGGSVDTRINLRHVRTWDGLTDNTGKPIYTPIGGSPSRPLDYKMLFRLKTPEAAT